MSPLLFADITVFVLSLLVGLLQPLLDPALARALADAKVTAVSLDGLPRTLSRAQSMDALTSQANVAGSVPERTVVTDGGVTVVGAGNLAAAVPRAASAAYARNVVALLSHLVADGRIVLDQADEITAGVLVTHDGEVVHPAVRDLLAREAREAGAAGAAGEGGTGEGEPA